MCAFIIGALTTYSRVTGSGIVGAALVSNPLCLHSSAAALSRPWTLPYLYNLALALRLKQYVHEHRAALASHVQARAAKPQGAVKGFYH